MAGRFSKLARAAGAAALFALALMGSAEAAGNAGQPSICSRACWGAQSSSLGSNMSALNRAIIHHTASSGDYNVSSQAASAAKVRATQSYHIGLGWGDIGYHFLVDKLGNAFEGKLDSLNKNTQRRGAHDGTNTNSFGFNFLGYYHSPYNNALTTAQKNKMYDVIAWRMPNGWSPYGAGTYNGKTVGWVDGHRDVKSTACPGDLVYNTIIGTNHNAGTIRNEISARINGAPPPPPPPPAGTVVTTLGGYYRVKSKVSGKYWDVSPDATLAGANVNQWDWWGGANQVFLFEHLGDGYYKISAKSAGPNIVLDVNSCGGAGANVQQWHWLNNDCQKFRVYDMGGGYARFERRGSTTVIDVAGCSTGNGGNIAMWNWVNNDCQKFQIEWVSIPVSNLSGYHKITSVQSGKVLDIAPTHTANGALLQQYDWLGGGNQIFSLDHQGSGYYKLTSKLSGKVIDVPSCGGAGTFLWQWDWLNNDCQKWLIEDVGLGQVRLTSKTNGLAMDVHNCSTANGGQIKIWPWGGNNCQKWTLAPVATSQPVEVIVDNTDPGFSASANWWVGSSTPGYYGTNYHVRSTEAVSDSAAWTVNLPDSGDYEVYAQWTSGENRASAASYIVYHTGGSTTVNVDQQNDGEQFIYLGTYNFAAGSSVKARLSCWTTSGDFVVADAVRFYKP